MDDLYEMEEDDLYGMAENDFGEINDWNKISHEVDDLYELEQDVYYGMDGYNKMEQDKWYRMNTPLLHCCTLGDIDMVKWCCINGADVNVCRNNGQSPLYIGI